jgi:ribosomal protein L11 methyltransferase
LSAWFQVSLNIPPAFEDTISGFLFRLGSLGIETEEGETSNRLIAFFSGSMNRNGVVADFRSLLARLWAEGELESCLDLNISLDEVPDEDWSNAWREHFKPVYPTPTLVICPPWNPVTPPVDGSCILIEPKMAFGTGHHETTSLALNILESVLSPGDTVLDAGTGSGILAIAAVKWGASRATGIDIDAQATECARENVELNGSTGRISLFTGSVDQGREEYDVVVANMISGVLMPLLPSLDSHTKASGSLVLSGLLKEEERTFLESILEAGLETVDVKHDGDWFGVLAQKAGI